MDDNKSCDIERKLLIECLNNNKDNALNCKSLVDSFNNCSVNTLTGTKY